MRLFTYWGGFLSFDTDVVLSRRGLSDCWVQAEHTSAAASS